MTVISAFTLRLPGLAHWSFWGSSYIGGGIAIDIQHARQGENTFTHVWILWTIVSVVPCGLDPYGTEEHSGYRQLAQRGIAEFACHPNRGLVGAITERECCERCCCGAGKSIRLWNASKIAVTLQWPVKAYELDARPETGCDT